MNRRSFIKGCSLLAALPLVDLKGAISTLCKWASRPVYHWKNYGATMTVPLHYGRNMSGMEIMTLMQPLRNQYCDAVYEQLFKPTPLLRRLKDVNRRETT